MMPGILNVRGALGGQWYTLLRPLTEGSSALFEARRDGLSEDCVVRLFPEIGAGTEAAQRIEIGARSALELRLVGVAQVVDFNGSEQPVFVAMERIGGRSLEKVMAEDGIFPLPRAAELVGQVANALAAGHTIGIGHGDLHPGAIRLMTDEIGRVVTKLVGLGWAGEARVASSDHRHAVYRAPEQRPGNQATTKTADASADQFALAAIAYEMLAGCSYLSEESSDLADPEARRWRQPPRVAEMVLGLPAGVDDVLRRALSYEPGARFASVSEFALALAGVADVQDRVTPVFAPLPGVTPPLTSGDRDDWPTPLPAKPTSRQPLSAKAVFPTVASEDPSDWLSPFSAGGLQEDDDRATPPPVKAVAPTVRSEDPAEWLTPTSVFLPAIDVVEMMPVETFVPPAPALNLLPGMPPAPAFAGTGGFMSPAFAIPKTRMSGRTQRLFMAVGAALVIAAGGIVVANVNGSDPVPAPVVLPAVERRTEPTVEPLALAVVPPRDPVRVVAAVTAPARASSKPARASSKKASRIGKRKYRASRQRARARHHASARDRVVAHRARSR